MRLTSQRRIAAQILNCGEKKVWFDKTRLEEVKQAITKADIRHLVKDKSIQRRPKRSISGYRSRKHLLQKRKGRRQGQGSRKGKRTARLSGKLEWMNKVRLQRSFLKELRDKKLIIPQNYHTLYRKSKGGFFRSKRHIKLYMEEHKLIKNEAKKKTRSSTKKTKKK